MNKENILNIFVSFFNFLKLPLILEENNAIPQPGAGTEAHIYIVDYIIAHMHVQGYKTQFSNQ